MSSDAGWGESVSLSQAGLRGAGDRPLCDEHVGVVAAARCLTCGRLLCAECREIVSGRDYCAAHAAAAREQAAAQARAVWSAGDLADSWTRTIAYAIDAVVLGLGGIVFSLYVLWITPVYALTRFYEVSGIGFLIMLAGYCTLTVGYGGQTLGHSLVRLRVVRTDGRPVSCGRAFLRWLGYGVCSATALLGFALATCDEKKQGLHDKLADTVVIGPRLPLAAKILSSVVLAAMICAGLALVGWFLDVRL